jgi:hypothetical protein
MMVIQILYNSLSFVSITQIETQTLPVEGQTQQQLVHTKKPRSASSNLASPSCISQHPAPKPTSPLKTQADPVSRSIMPVPKPPQPHASKGKALAETDDLSPPLRKSFMATKKPPTLETYLITTTPIRRESSLIVRALNPKLSQSNIVEALKEVAVAIKPIDAETDKGLS